MSSYKPKTWAEKLNVDRQPQVEKVACRYADIRPGDKMLIPTPKVVDDYIRMIPKGKEVDMSTIRKDLAAEYNADVTCPLTTGIFIRIVAEAAYESYKAGKPINEITPFWRVIDEKSKVASKLTFGKEFLMEQRRKEKIGKKNKSLVF